MLVGPDEAARRCLERNKLSYDDVDLFEVNEAFAAVVLDFMKRSGGSAVTGSTFRGEPSPMATRLARLVRCWLECSPTILADLARGEA